MHTAVVAVYYIETAYKLVKSYSARVLTPSKVSMLFPKYFENYKTAVITATTAFVAIYYIKTA